MGRCQVWSFLFDKKKICRLFCLKTFRIVFSYPAVSLFLGELDALFTSIKIEAAQVGEDFPMLTLVF
jgi:hypothetical protein